MDGQPEIEKLLAAVLRTGKPEVKEILDLLLLVNQ